jgi:hypothetical protein
MPKITTAASIGIGVPLGVILLAAFAGIIYSLTAKRKNPRGDVELTKTDATGPPAAAPRVIKWNPNGTIVMPVGWHHALTPGSSVIADGMEESSIQDRRKVRLQAVWSRYDGAS